MQFCHSCGKKMPQVALKFCPHCGVNLTSLASTPPPEEPAATLPQRPRLDQRERLPASGITIRRPQLPQEALDDDDYDPYQHGQRLDIEISGLDVEIGQVRPNRETIGGLMAAGPAGEESRGVGKMTKKAQKELLAATLREGAAIRPHQQERKPATS